MPPSVQQATVLRVLVGTNPPPPPPPVAQVIPTAQVVPEPHGPGLPANPVPANTPATRQMPSGQIVPATTTPSQGAPVNQPYYRDPVSGQLLANQEAARRSLLRDRLSVPQAVPAGQPVPVPPSNVVPASSTIQPTAPSGVEIGQLLHKAFGAGRAVGGFYLVAKGDPPPPTPYVGDAPLALGILATSFRVAGPVGPFAATGIIVGRAISANQDLANNSPVGPSEQIERIMERLSLAQSRMIRVEEATDP